MNEKENKENKVIFIGLTLIILIILFTISKNSFNDKNEVKTETKNKTALFTDYKYITALELNKKIIDREKITLIDIRDTLSFEKNHIENSLSISENLKEKISTLDKNQFTVIIGYDYDKKKDESIAMETLKDSGFNNISALSGGITGWAQEGNQLISGGDKESALDWSKIDQITVDQLKLAIDNKYPVFIIDTRANFQYSAGHIPGAINISLSELENRKSEIPISKEILVYGASADDDFKASVKLNDLGFLATYAIQGGFKAWEEKRFELQR